MVDLKGLNVGKYLCQVTYGETRRRSTEFIVVDQPIYFNSVYYELTEDIMEEPSIFQDYPAKLDFKGKTAQDSSWIHLVVSAEGMDHIYLSIKKIDTLVDESVNKYAVDGRIIAF